ncbi:MAG TPA: BsuBI/PstI family type II restriction endonuclease [Candidatus Glassbacteria bacterium]|nr:BsuBI/PstI family type II restriction endonuclease [Candidatus Glassbacteria bacterium]
MGKIEEGIYILKSLGLPRAQQNERSALTLLALLDLKEDDSWSVAKQRIIRIHDILVFIQENYGRKYAENTRETIRRQTLHQFEQGGIVVKNPDNPRRPTNSPNTVYAISDEALRTIGKYGTYVWNSALNGFIKKKGKLIEVYEKKKRDYMISVDLPDGTLVRFSPGKHNRLQIKIIKEFRARFCPNTKVVYVGDTARKMLYIDEVLMKKINLPITKHDKLPDVVLFDSNKNHLLLIEAVTAHGPLSPKRQIELEKTLEECEVKRIYLSAFPDFKEFKRHIDNIAWETEVWIEENPDHMIHFNGSKFFTVYDE